MPDIKQFSENGTQFYPETHVTAVIDSNGTSVDELLSGKQPTIDSSHKLDYSLISNTPTIPSAPGTLVTNKTTAQTASSGEAMSGTINLHKVAKTGTYSDLIGTPTIPTVNNSTITVQMNGATVDTFTTNASSAKTINLGGNYVKYVLCADEAAYTSITTKDSGTLYLIPKTS